MTDSSSGENRPTNMWEELNRPKDRDGEPQPREEERKDKAAIPLAGVIGGAVAIAAVAFAGFIVVGGDDGAVEEQAVVAQDDPLALENSDVVTAGDDAGADDADAVDTDPTTDDGATDPTTDDGATDPTTDDGTTDPVTDDTTTDDASDEEPAATDDAYSPAVQVGAEGNHVILSRGKLYLRGELPSPLIEIGAVNALEEIMGEGNVISEYVINPEAPFEMGSPADVFIEDTVLFEFASAEIAPDFYPLLGLGVVLMQIQDGVTIEVYGHTDSAGSDETNLTLSQARVDAVKAFWVSQGADPSRITAIGKGETEPVADNSTPEGQQLNRRVEIVITGFVFSL